MKPLSLALLTAAGFVFLAVLYSFDPAQYRLYPTCVLHQATGLWCPGCGALRASHQLLHGHVALALRYNALLVLSLPLLAWWAALVARQGWCAVPRVRAAWLWTALVVVVVFGVLRNVPCTQLAWLAPPG